MVRPSPSRIRFSNDDFASEQHLARRTEGFVHRHMKMGFVDRSTDGLRFAVELICLGPVAAGLVRTTPSSFIRKCADSNDTLFMLIGRRGGFAVVQHGQQHQLPNGAAAVFDDGRAGEIHCIGEGEALILSLPRLALRHLVPDVDKIVERIIPDSHPSLRLLTRYVEALFEIDHIDDPQLAAVHVADLVASLLGGRDDAQRPADETAPRTARRAAALDMIDLHLADPDLDPRRVAQTLKFSIRYLHRLLEETGRTFSQHVLARRLDRAHRLLRDPRMANLKISEIALNAGFSDLSHFNRSFRRRFGETPSAARAAVMRGEINMIDPPERNDRVEC